MSKPDQQFLEIRALRNAALANLKADIEHVKTGLSGKGLAERTVGRIATGAKDTLDQAKTTASDNGGVLAALLGALALWFAREPILEALGIEEASDDNKASNNENGEDVEAPEIVLTPPDPVMSTLDTADQTIPGDDHE
ncbi:MAG: hypothetical protein AAGL68_01375 [Pseudomonadota bacterium]